MYLMFAPPVTEEVLKEEVRKQSLTRGLLSLTPPADNIAKHYVVSVGGYILPTDPSSYTRGSCELCVPGTYLNEMTGLCDVCSNGKVRVRDGLCHELRKRVYGVLVVLPYIKLLLPTSTRYSNAINTSSFAARFARRSTLTISGFIPAPAVLLGSTTLRLQLLPQPIASSAPRASLQRTLVQAHVRIAESANTEPIQAPRSGLTV